MKIAKAQSDSLSRSLPAQLAAGILLVACPEPIQARGWPASALAYPPKRDDDF
jgi:hypothetical protein